VRGYSRIRSTRSLRSCSIHAEVGSTREEAKAEDETLVCTFGYDLNHAVDNFRASERENRLHPNPIELGYARS
jgi:hypothetical protein